MEDGLDDPDVQEERAHSLPSCPLYGIGTDN
jgi:hypothetical protein